MERSCPGTTGSPRPDEATGTAAGGGFRIVSSILAGEVPVAEAARRTKPSRKSRTGAARPPATTRARRASRPDFTPRLTRALKHLTSTTSSGPGTAPGSPRQVPAEGVAGLGKDRQPRPFMIAVLVTLRDPGTESHPEPVLGRFRQCPFSHNLDADVDMCPFAVYTPAGWGWTVRGTITLSPMPEKKASGLATLRPAG